MALAALLTLTLQWGCQPAPAGISEVGELAETERRQRRIPDLSVVVLRGDDELLAQGYGRAELGRTDPVTARTVFQLGSISKQFLAALVVALAADGTLSLDDPAVQHLPDFPRLPPDLRVRHLLEHTSGVRELFTLPESETAYDDLSRSREELAEAVRNAPVDFPPGSRWSYSNTNYTLLAFLVERLTSLPYERALAERFFEPLGLSSLRQCTPLPLEPSEARGHELQDGDVAAASPEHMNWIRGDGGLCGSAVDLARWFRLLSSDRVLSEGGFQRMTEAARLIGGERAPYGFGLSLVRAGPESRGSVTR